MASTPDTLMCDKSVTPRRRNLRALAVALALMLHGCARRETLDPTLSARRWDLAFLAVTDAGRQPSRTTSPFGIAEDGSLLYGSLPELELSEGDSRFFLVGLSAQDIGAIAPSANLGALAGARVEIGAPPASPRVISSGLGLVLVEMAVPPGAEVLEVVESEGPEHARLIAPAAADAAPVLGSLVLRLEACALPAQAPLRRFGRDARAIPEQPAPADLDPGLVAHLERVQQVARLDADHVVALSNLGVYLLRRGERAPVAALDNQSLPGGAGDGFTYCRAFALGPPAAGGEPRRLLVIGRDRDRKPAVFEGAVSPVGFAPARTATVSGPPLEHDLRDVVIDSRGHAIAVGQSGLVLLRRAGEPAFTQLRDAARGDLSLIIETGWPEEPHVIGADGGTLFIGDAAAGRLVEHAVGDPFLRASKLQFFSMATDPDHRDLWIGADGRLLRGSTGGQFSLVPIQLPTSLVRCVRQMDGGLALSGDANDIVFSHGHAVVAVRGCSALITFRTSDLCMSLVPRGDEEAGPTDLTNASLDAAGGVLTLGGSRGLVFETTLVP